MSEDPFRGSLLWLLRNALGRTQRGQPLANEAAPVSLAQVELTPDEDAAFAPILAELETVRQDTERRINERLRLFVPLGLIAGAVLGIALWIFHAGKDPLGNGLLAFVLVAAGSGLLAIGQPYAAYIQLYKQRVLPRLAASFGALDWRPAQPPLDEIKRYGLFSAWNKASAQDEIHGDYHGLPLSIMDLSLDLNQNKSHSTVFSGTLVSITLPRHLHGVTVIGPGRDTQHGFFKDLFGRHPSGALQAVALEDPEFSKAFHVQATDQIAARALLTPAFMQRFLALTQQGFTTPAALAQDNKIMLALPGVGRGNGIFGGGLFAAPSYRKPATARETLAAMRASIAAILRIADALLELDQSTRQASTAPATAAVP